MAATFASIRKRPPGTVVEKAAIPDSPPLPTFVSLAASRPISVIAPSRPLTWKRPNCNKVCKQKVSFNRLAGEAQGRMVRARVVSAI